MKKFILLIYLTSFVCGVADKLYAQTSGFCFAENAGGLATSEFGGIVIGNSDNIVITGDLDGSVFLASYSKDSGTLIWSKTYRGQSSSAAGFAIVADGSSSLITGHYKDDFINFGTDTLVNSGKSDVFVTKLTSIGTNVTVNWARKAGGTGNDQGTGIAVDDNGDVYVIGIFEGTIFFEGSPSPSLTTDGDDDIFVAKFDRTDGDLIWARRAGGSQRDTGFAITADNNGNSYITGEFSGNANFGEGGNNVQQLNSNGGSRDIFVAKYDTNGNLVWAKKAGGSSTDRARGIHRFIDEDDPDGVVDHLYVVGRFQGSASFGSFNLTSEGGRDIAIARYDNDGNVLWAKSAGGTGEDEGRAVFSIKRTDPEGPQDVTVQITGEFSGNATFGKNEPNQTKLNTAGATDVFIAKYASEGGRLLWAKKAGSNSADFGKGIAVDTEAFDGGNELPITYLVGNFTAVADFGSNRISPSAAEDMFITRVEDFSMPRNLNFQQIQDSGLSSFVKLSWDPPVNSTAPTISSPSFNNTGTPCTLADGTPGTRFNINLSFSDSDGDVSNGSAKVNVESGPLPFGSSVDLISGSESFFGGPSFLYKALS